MTPEQIKARELVERFMPFAYSVNDKGQLIHSIHLYNAKQGALICVDEILKGIMPIVTRNRWLSVKKEIELL